MLHKFDTSTAARHKPTQADKSKSSKKKGTSTKYNLANPFQRTEILYNQNLLNTQPQERAWKLARRTKNAKENKSNGNYNLNKKVDLPQAYSLPLSMNIWTKFYNKKALQLEALSKQ